MIDLPHTEGLQETCRLQHASEPDNAHLRGTRTCTCINTTSHFDIESSKHNRSRTNNDRFHSYSRLKRKNPPTQRAIPFVFGSRKRREKALRVGIEGYIQSEVDETKRPHHPIHPGARQTPITSVLRPNVAAYAHQTA